jgi:hypothetical protein
VSGCNYAAKNTVLMNYLPDARNHGATIFTRVEVRYLQRRNDRWLVHYQVLDTGRECFDAAPLFVSADIVVLAAGALGSEEGSIPGALADYLPLAMVAVARASGVDTAGSRSRRFAATRYAVTRWRDSPKSSTGGYPGAAEHRHRCAMAGRYYQQQGITTARSDRPIAARLSLGERIKTAVLHRILAGRFFHRSALRCSTSMNHRSSSNFCASTSTTTKSQFPVSASPDARIRSTHRPLRTGHHCTVALCPVAGLGSTRPSSRCEVGDAPGGGCVQRHVVVEQFAHSRGHSQLGTQ